MMRGVIGDLDPEITIADRLYDFDRRVFGIDDMPRADIEAHARTVAEKVAERLRKSQSVAGPKRRSGRHELTVCPWFELFLERMPIMSPEISLYSPAVAELVAIGAAIAANCEPCFKYHYAQAQKLGVSSLDMARAVAMANSVKEPPARAMLTLARALSGLHRIS